LLLLFSDPPTTERYTLSLHDALPIFAGEPWYRSLPGRRRFSGVSRESAAAVTGQRTKGGCLRGKQPPLPGGSARRSGPAETTPRSEEHTSELQSRENLVCRLLLEKKK